MPFHLGKPIVVMAAVAVVSGVGVMLREEKARADLTFWAFSDSHVTSYRGARGTPRSQTIVGQFEREHGKTVDIVLVNTSAENIRLGAMFDREHVDPNQPDAVEIEIGSVVRDFRPPLEQVGLMPLNDFLARDGWRDRILESRLAPWTKDGVVFGLPHDVHPVSITYRKDLFDEAGIDLASATTWPAFHEKCVQFQNYWRARGVGGRHAMELPTAAADYLVVMLLQRGVSLLDQNNRVHFTDPKVAPTVAFYAQMVGGARAVGADATPGGHLWARDFVNGDVCAIFTPDWRAGYLKLYGAEAAGKAAMMPLPRFDDDDFPTGSWGGTMGAIPKRCKDPEAAWKLLTHLYSSKQGIDTRWKTTGILPAFKDLWAEPVFHEPDPYFGGQKVGELYIELAQQMPIRHVTSFSTVANTQLAMVLARAVELVDGGLSGDALEREIQSLLADAGKDLERRVEFGKFE